MSDEILPLTRIETLRKVYDHLVRQGRRAYMEGAGCRYRTPEGDRCAAGVAIPDELYDRTMEGHSIRGVLRDLPVLWSHFEVADLSDEDALNLWLACQRVHDRAGNWDADGFKLSFPEFLTLVNVSVP